MPIACRRRSIRRRRGSQPATQLQERIVLSALTMRILQRLSFDYYQVHFVDQVPCTGIDMGTEQARQNV